MIKIFNKVGIEGTYLNIIKAVYDKPTANIILSGKKLKAFPLRSEARHGCRLSPFCSTQYWKPGSQQSERKRNKVIQIEKEEVKLSLLTDDMVVYIENPKDTTKKTI